MKEGCNVIRNLNRKQGMFRPLSDFCPPPPFDLGLTCPLCCVSDVGDAPASLNPPASPPPTHANVISFTQSAQRRWHSVSFLPHEITSRPTWASQCGWGIWLGFFGSSKNTGSRTDPDPVLTRFDHALTWSKQGIRYFSPDPGSQLDPTGSLFDHSVGRPILGLIINLGMPHKLRGSFTSRLALLLL